jgi:hypothetical protein
MFYIAISMQEDIIIVLTPTITKPIRRYKLIISMSMGLPAVMDMTTVPIKIIVMNKSSMLIRGAVISTVTISMSSKKRKSTHAVTTMTIIMSICMSNSINISINTNIIKVIEKLLHMPMKDHAQAIIMNPHQELKS